jgi:hypothetical protein
MAANLELQALEDLEKELGLDEFNVSTTSAVGARASASVVGGSNSVAHTTPSNKGDLSSTGAVSMVASAGVGAQLTPMSACSKEDDDNLDELEKYLQNLNSTPL